MWQRHKNLIIAVIVIAILAVGSVSAAFVYLLKPAQFTIPLWYNSDGHYGDTEPTVAQVVASAIEKTGKINVQLKSEPWAQYTTDFGNGNLPFFLLGWYPDYFDADDYASPFLGTAGAASLGSEYSNTTMNVRTTDRIKSLDPAYAYDYFSIEIINQIFDTLLVYSPTDTTLLPGIATTVPTVANGLVSPDLKTWTYPLKSGVTFSDGTVL